MSTVPGRLLVVEIAVVVLLASGSLFGCGRLQENPANAAAEVSASEKNEPAAPQAPAENKGGAAAKAEDPPREGRIRAPELQGGVNWLNTASPLRLRDLRGKVVILDFWTFCCINCIHALPDLAKLEKKYANQLVVVGVHSAKFDNEKDSENIRKAILRYEISHPVVNDAQRCAPFIHLHLRNIEHRTERNSKYERKSRALSCYLPDTPGHENKKRRQRVDEVARGEHIVGRGPRQHECQNRTEQQPSDQEHQIIARRKRQRAEPSRVEEAV